MPKGTTKDNKSRSIYVCRKCKVAKYVQVKESLCDECLKQDNKPPSMPKRYQRKRIRGWRKADHCPDAVFVGRGTKWGNPFAVGGPRLHGSIAYTNEGSVSLFKEELKAGHLGFTIEDVKRELKGKDLMCWCREDEPWCHGDVLLEIANSTSGSIPQVQECGRPTETVCPKHKSRLCHCPGVV